MKKYLLMTMLMLVNLVAWGAEGDHVAQLNITSQDALTVVPNYTKFAEPLVTVTKVVDGVTTTLTNKYIIKYYISGHENDVEASMTVNSRKAKVTTDATTGTQVELLFGNVVFGATEGVVTIKVKATPINASGDTPSVLEGSYDVTIASPRPVVTFTPLFPIVDSQDVITFYYDQYVADDEWNSGKYKAVITGATAALPTPKITINGIDVTSHYTITSSLSEHGAEFYNTLKKSNPTGKGDIIVFEKQTVRNLVSEEAAKEVLPKQNAKLTYVFTPSAGYPSIDSKEVVIRFKKIDAEDMVDGKLPLHLDLTRAMFLQDDVTTDKDIDGDGNNDFVIHVYKYGSQEHTEQGKYQYCTPNPSILSKSNSPFPVYCTRGTGAYGDMQLFYQVFDGNSKQNQYADGVFDPEKDDVTGKTLLGTYYDDCGTLPFYSNGDIIAPGLSTGITVPEDRFQTNRPGLVKVAVYGVLPKNSDYAADLKGLLLPIKEGGNDKILKNQWGAEYIVYTEPVYFYIDVMKRIPKLSFDPDPSTLVFGTNDKIDMKNRFNVSGSITDNSNGIAGTLTWGANSGNFEDDHFAYTFFISDHAAQVIKVNDWPTTFQKYVDGHWVKDQETWAANEWTHPYTGEKFYGDQYAFRSYKTLTAEDKIVKQVGGVKVMKGDKIVVGDELVEITEDNYETYKDRVLVAGDQISGTTYNSVKGFGEAFEKWTITFEHSGSYDIEYTIRPWNHTRWDIGSNVAGTKTYTYIIQDKADTELRLSYYETTTEKDSQWSFDEPSAKVFVTSSNNEVTEKFDMHYTISSTDNTVDATYTISEESDIVGHTGTYVVYKKNGDVIIKVNKTTGEVFVGNIEEDVKIRVSATVMEAYKDAYNNPADKVYTIHVKDFSGNAQWDIISTCKTNPDELPASNSRFTSLATELGRFHYIGAGTIIGGTQVKGVPGIMMTVGASGDNTWQAITSDKDDLPLCCNHETKPVIVQSTNALGLDADGNPVVGTFYQFNPSASGLLTLDANVANGTAIALMKKDLKTGKAVEIQTIDITADKTDDVTFTKPLVAGETYYVFNTTTGALRLHGFKYETKYLVDENTTVNGTTTATLFMNGFSTGIPTISAGANDNIVYTIEMNNSVISTINNGIVTSEYVDIDENGGLTAKKMTIDGSGNIFKIKVIATVKSSEETTFGDCIAQSSSYDLEIIDIPTYKLEDYDAYLKSGGVDNGLRVRTTNIPTAITMTFSGWKDTDNRYGDKDGKEDQWSYKSVAGENSRIGSELDDDDPTYNLTIDGFGFYNAGNQNPVDEKNANALNNKAVGSGGNNNSYTFASGTEAEQSKTTYYNTTYRLPARGAFVKFEPEESGILLVYLVQNGSVDYHYGIGEVSSQYKLKWRPLYITDETGNTIKMVGEEHDDHSFNSVSKYLPTNGDNTNVGYYTRGLSRCNKRENAIEEAMSYLSEEERNKLDVKDGCSFDWSEFRGNDTDKNNLMNAWQPKGQRESIIRLADGGFALPHKAYVRYVFQVKAGKTYFVFQPGSKFEFGGFSFVPNNYPSGSKYGLTWTDKTDPDMMNWTAESRNIETNRDLSWTTTSAITAGENLNVTMWDEEGTSSKKRTFSKDKWNSICLPFSVNETQIKEKFGDGCILVTVDGINTKGQLQFTRHANRYIEAGRPYLVKPTIDCKSGVLAKDEYLKFHNVTIERGTSVKIVNGTQDIVDPTRFDVNIDDEFIFRGFYNQQTLAQGAVFAASDGLYSSTKNSTIGGYRAMFDLPTSGNASGAKALSFVITDMREELDVDQTTGVVYVTNDNEILELPQSVGVYNLGGTKIGNGVDALNGLNKGIYIVDGKKFVVK